MKTEYEGKSAEELAELLEQRDADLTKAEEDKTATVGELKDMRTKNQELSSALEEAKQTKTEQPTGDEDGKPDTAAEVERVLNERAVEEAKQNRERALESFRASQHEFSEAADPGGIKFAAFEREMQKFNFNGLKSVEDFSSRLGEVHDFMNRGQEKPAEDNPSPYRGASQDTGSDAPAGGDHELSSQEKKLMQQTGWSKERLLALKEKQPSFYEQQLGLVV